MEKEILFEYLLAAVLIILPLVLIYFEFQDSKKEKKKKEAPKKNKGYIDRIEGVEVKEPYTALDDIDLIARDFFTELFDAKRFPGYYALKKEFEKQDKKNEALFCKIMDEFLYEENKPKIKHIKKLLEIFEKIILENELHQKEEDEKTKNKNTKKSAKSS